MPHNFSTHKQKIISFELEISFDDCWRIDECCFSKIRDSLISKRIQKKQILTEKSEKLRLLRLFTKVICYSRIFKDPLGVCIILGKTGILCGRVHINGQYFSTSAYYSFYFDSYCVSIVLALSSKRSPRVQVREKYIWLFQEAKLSSMMEWQL